MEEYLIFKDENIIATTKTFWWCKPKISVVNGILRGESIEEIGPGNYILVRYGIDSIEGRSVIGLRFVTARKLDLKKVLKLPVFGLTQSPTKSFEKMIGTDVTLTKPQIKQFVSWIKKWEPASVLNNADTSLRNMLGLKVYK